MFRREKKQIEPVRVVASTFWKQTRDAIINIEIWAQRINMFIVYT